MGMSRQGAILPLPEHADLSGACLPSRPVQTRSVCCLLRVKSCWGRGLGRGNECVWGDRSDSESERRAITLTLSDTESLKAP